MQLNFVSVGSFSSRRSLCQLHHIGIQVVTYFRTKPSKPAARGA